MKNTFATLIALLLGALWCSGCTGGAAGGIAGDKTLSEPRAAKGVIDLSEVDLGGPSVKLQGEWRFFPHQLLAPGDLDSGVNLSGQDGTGPAQYIPVPAAWNDIVFDGEPFPKTGYGTYALDIVLDRPGGPLGMKLYTIGTAYDLWVDGKKLASCGVVGTSEATMAASMKPQVVYFTPEKARVRIVMQVSNFKDRFGGIWSEVYLGNAARIAVHNNVDIALEMIIFGVFAIVGLYYAISWFVARSDSSTIFFSVCCLMIALRTLSAGENFLMTMFPGVDFELNYKVMFLSQAVMAAFIIMFLYSLFPSEIPRTAVRIIQGLMAVYGAVIIFTPLVVFSNLLAPFCVFCVIVGIYASVMVVIALARKRPESGIVLAAFVILFVTVTNDILYANLVIDSGYMMTCGLIVFSILFIVVISLRMAGIHAESRKRVMAALLDEKAMTTLCLRHGISRREMEVIPLLVKGMDYKAISERLFISVSTLRKHIHSIYGKFGVKNRTGLDFYLRSRGKDSVTGE